MDHIAADDAVFLLEHLLACQVVRRPLRTTGEEDYHPLLHSCYGALYGSLALLLGEAVVCRLMDISHCQPQRLSSLLYVPSRVDAREAQCGNVSPLPALCAHSGLVSA